MAHSFGDRLGRSHVGSVQIDIEGDQRRACADHRGPGRPQVRRAEIRRPVGVGGDLGLQPFILAAPHIGQVASFGTRCSLFVQIDRDAQLGADPLAQPAGKRYAVVHRRPLHRDKGHDVGRPHAWVGAAVVVHVDELSCAGNTLESGLERCFWRANQRHHRAVVIYV